MKENNFTPNKDENNKTGKEKKVKSDDQWNCPICFDKLRSPVVTHCGHVFCYDCIDRWLMKSDKCPMCTNHINRDELIVVPGHGETQNIGTQERRQHSKWNINDAPTCNQKIIFVILILLFIFILFQ
ncbi:hypothetical protein M9Y10_042964 [Tritrichomonas musculus]|uniref:RING-type E3 ubiquitin transferase n=1 Tax=Tritrichomonas musculus TaxID=1915356 RepID=A0ABR2JYE8_9EUKA